MLGQRDGSQPKDVLYENIICRNGSSWQQQLLGSSGSDGRRKGSGNTKNGNKYLAWAYREASELARRFDKACRGYYQRKMQRTNAAVAHSALAHKLARAGYYLMRDGGLFQAQKLFR